MPTGKGPTGFEEFIKEVVPLLGLSWRPFKRRGIRRRLERRLVDIGVSSFAEYGSRVKKDAGEQAHLSRILTVTISRFFRDRDVFNQLETSIFPAILERKNPGKLGAWSIGCASGEEPYSLSLLWRARFERDWSQVELRVVATDIDAALLERAKEGKYKESSLREVPGEILKEYFKPDGEGYMLDKGIRESVKFRTHDVLRDEPLSGMDVILCRNLAFTYFSRVSQLAVMGKVADSLDEEGYFIIGKEESLPLSYPTLFVPVLQREKIYQRFR
jgi:chemotaxis protein methyltransferase CheR